MLYLSDTAKNEMDIDEALFLCGAEFLVLFEEVWANLAKNVE